MKALQITKATRDIVAERSNDLCEVCGQERATQMHHRFPRGMGGSRDVRIHQPSMLLHVGNACHERIEKPDRGEAYDEGWLVKRVGEAPCLTWHGYVIFDDEGGWLGLGFEKPREEHTLGCTFWTSDDCDCGGGAVA